MFPDLAQIYPSGTDQDTDLFLVGNFITFALCPQKKWN